MQGSKLYMYVGIESYKQLLHDYCPTDESV
jgi:hypothetical protein